MKLSPICQGVSSSSIFILGSETLSKTLLGVQLPLGLDAQYIRSLPGPFPDQTLPPCHCPQDHRRHHLHHPTFFHLGCLSAHRPDLRSSYPAPHPALHQSLPHLHLQIKGQND